MPYTPPGQQSPAATTPDSPPRSRDGRAVKSLPSSSPFLSGPRPNLPRSNSSSSTSYLHRHRRSPSSPNVSLSYSLDSESPLSHVETHDWVRAPHASLRQSPPPVNNLTIPTGTIISPPDSGNNSSDDEGLTMASGHDRKLNNLAELQAAISVIEQAREKTPGWADEEKRNTRVALGLDSPSDVSSPTLQLPSSGRPPLSKEARKISHSRSATETAIVTPRSYSPLEGSSDSDLDEETARNKPKMLRKKSGELVRPALRPASRRRPSSMPGTPTFGKAVHFSSDLEHVRHFLQVDKPLAVSAETSPVETFEDESEFPFPEDQSSRAPSFEWDIRLGNFPTDTPERKQMPVKVERIFLSSNKKTLIGTVAVQNLAFHKTVVARFTFDYWKTTSEVTAEFSHDVRRQQPNDGLDRFNFNLQLTDQNNLENKTLFFCVRYVVGGQEFWDSNNMVNYQVDFVKKQAPVKEKAQTSRNEATRPINGLPRSHSPQKSPTRRNFDDFGRGFDSFWSSGDAVSRAKPAINLLDDSGTPLKFRSKASGNALEDVPSRRQAKGPAQALGNRYDFNKSLSAALTAASSALGERSGLPLSPAASSPLLSPPGTQAAAVAFSANLQDEEFGNGNSNSKTASPRAGSVAPQPAESSPLSGSDSPSPVATPSPEKISPSQERVQAAVESVAERLSRSASPARSDLGSKAASPSSFGYPYHQSLSNGFTVPTAIRG